MFKAGLVSVSFRGDSPEKTVEYMKKAGLEYIEWGSDVHAPFNDEEKLKKIKILQEESGIKCCSYGSYFRLGKDKPELIKEYIKAAKILGTDIIRVWCGEKSAEKFTAEEKASLYAECKAVAEIAEKENIKICLECHHDTYTDDPCSVLDLMEKIDSPNFRMYWQPNEFKSDEFNLDYAEKIADYTEHIHIFNWHIYERFPLSEGIEIWKRYLKKFSPDRFVLLEFMPDDNIESLPGEAHTLNKLLTELNGDK